MIDTSYYQAKLDRLNKELDDIIRGRVKFPTKKEKKAAAASKVAQIALVLDAQLTAELENSREERRTKC